MIEREEDNLNITSQEGVLDRLMPYLPTLAELYSVASIELWTDDFQVYKYFQTALTLRLPITPVSINKAS